MLWGSNIFIQSLPKTFEILLLNLLPWITFSDSYLELLVLFCKMPCTFFSLIFILRLSTYMNSFFLVCFYIKPLTINTNLDVRLKERNSTLTISCNLNPRVNIIHAWLIYLTNDRYCKVIKPLSIPY